MSWLGRAYQKDRRPKPLISLERTILTSLPKSEDGPCVRGTRRFASFTCIRCAYIRESAVAAWMSAWANEKVTKSNFDFGFDSCIALFTGLEVKTEVR